MNVKICTQCEDELSATSEFFYKSNGKFGFNSWCKKCMKRWRKTNKDHLSDYDEKYYKQNKEKILEYQSTYGKKYYKENKDRITTQRRTEIGREVKRRANKKYYEKTKIVRNVSRLMRRCLGSNKNNGSWEELVGYTLNDLKIHLEVLWEKGMSWENYGQFGWHIDHIRPIAFFDVNKLKDKYSEEFKECWDIKNLQPLWWRDNIRKGAKVNEDSI